MNDYVGVPVIDLAKVTKTYSGKTGCACGCGGDYYYMPSESKPDYEQANLRGAKMRVNKIIKAFADGRPVEVFHYDDESIYELENETGTRVVRVYVQH